MITNKNNYWKMGWDEIINNTHDHKKPTLLLHACCAPCGCFPIELLSDYFHITLFYNNSNIYPQAEYLKRLHELEDYVKIINEQLVNPVKLVILPYDNDNYTNKLAVLKNLPEGQGRCFLCYALRMREGFQYAEDHHFDYFTTVMTISRQKNSTKINEIGTALAHLFKNTRYFYSDFKKNRGIDRALELRKQYNLYQQQYCGCIYSYQANNKIKK